MTQNDVVWLLILFLIVVPVNHMGWRLLWSLSFLLLAADSEQPLVISFPMGPLALIVLFGSVYAMRRDEAKRGAVAGPGSGA